MLLSLMNVCTRTTAEPHAEPYEGSNSNTHTGKALCKKTIVVHTLGSCSTLEVITYHELHVRIICIAWKAGWHTLPNSVWIVWSASAHQLFACMLIGICPSDTYTVCMQSPTPAPTRSPTNAPTPVSWLMLAHVCCPAWTTDIACDPYYSWTKTAFQVCCCSILQRYVWWAWHKYIH